MIEVRSFSREEIKRAYDARSWIYSKIVAPREHRYHVMAVETANILPGENVLEVAVGPGLTLRELAQRVGGRTTIYGTDLSPKMLKLASPNMLAAGFPHFDLREADCRDLPFEDARFDLVYNGFMLDLMSLEDLPLVVSEFKRVLKPGGRLVLLNKSKKDGGEILMERLYRSLPAWFVLYVFGLCRPVLMEPIVTQAGFEHVSRQFVDGFIAAEIVTARKR